jgi:hypothetical protein
MIDVNDIINGVLVLYIIDIIKEEVFANAENEAVIGHGLIVTM